MPIILKPRRTTTANYVPTTTDLVDGEFAVNTADRVIYQRSGSAIIPVASLNNVPRVGTVASSATPAINTDLYDMFIITALAVNITSMSTNLTGTLKNGQKLWVSITGTAARTIVWGASFESSTATLPTTTTSTDRLDVGFVYNAATLKLRCVAVA